MKLLKISRNIALERAIEMQRFISGNAWSWSICPIPVA
jgi:hypothetical protein